MTYSKEHSAKRPEIIIDEVPFGRYFSINLPNGLFKKTRGKKIGVR